MDVVLDIVILMTREWRFVFARGIMVADYVLQLH